MENHGYIVIYKDKDGNNNIEVKMQNNTVWLNLSQLVKLYNSSKSNISEHIKHIIEEGDQNKMHWAVNGHTAAEIIVERADSNKDFMGLTTFSGDCPTLADARLQKNYLTDKELDILNRLVSMYLDYAKLQAIEEKTMTMQDWVKELNYFFSQFERE